MKILGFEIKWIGFNGYSKREIKKIYKNSGKILAIKYVRNKNKKFNLREAKEIVDKILKNKKQISNKNIQSLFLLRSIFDNFDKK